MEQSSYMYIIIKYYLRISSCIRKPFLIYDFANAPLWISLYMRNILFSFLSGMYWKKLRIWSMYQNSSRNLWGWKGPWIYELGISDYENFQILISNTNFSKHIKNLTSVYAKPLSEMLSGYFHFWSSICSQRAIFLILRDDKFLASSRLKRFLKSRSIYSDIIWLN